MASKNPSQDQTEDSDPYCQGVYTRDLTSFSDQALGEGTKPDRGRAVEDLNKSLSVRSQQQALNKVEGISHGAKSSSSVHPIQDDERVGLKASFRTMEDKFERLQGRQEEIEIKVEANTKSVRENVNKLTKRIQDLEEGKDAQISGLWDKINELKNKQKGFQERLNDAHTKSERKLKEDIQSTWKKLFIASLILVAFVVVCVPYFSRASKNEYEEMLSNTMATVEEQKEKIFEMEKAMFSLPQDMGHSSHNKGAASKEELVDLKRNISSLKSEIKLMQKKWDRQNALTTNDKKSKGIVTYILELLGELKWMFILCIVVVGLIIKFERKTNRGLMGEEMNALKSSIQEKTEVIEELQTDKRQKDEAIEGLQKQVGDLMGDRKQMNEAVESLKNSMQLKDRDTNDLQEILVELDVVKDEIKSYKQANSIEMRNLQQKEIKEIRSEIRQIQSTVGCMGGKF